MLVMRRLEYAFPECVTQATHSQHAYWRQLTSFLQQRERSLDGEKIASSRPAHSDHLHNNWAHQNDAQAFLYIFPYFFVEFWPRTGVYKTIGKSNRKQPSFCAFLIRQQKSKLRIVGL